jgi:hypothetical protein
MPPYQACSHPCVLLIQVARQLPRPAQAAGVLGEVLPGGEEVDGVALDPMDGIRSLVATAKLV